MLEYPKRSRNSPHWPFFGVPVHLEPLGVWPEDFVFDSLDIRTPYWALVEPPNCGANGAAKNRLSSKNCYRVLLVLERRGSFVVAPLTPCRFLDFLHAASSVFTQMIGFSIWVVPIPALVNISQAVSSG